MYVPQGIKALTTGPGSYLVGGMALISLVMAGATFGWIGVAAVVVGLFALVFIEVWREAGATVSQKDDLQADLVTARQESQAVPGLRSQVTELQSAVTQLEEANRRPRLAPEEILEVITAHVGLIELTENHRTLGATFEDIPITRVEMSPEGDVRVEGISPNGPQRLEGEVLTVVQPETGTVFGGSFYTHENDRQIDAGFSLDGVPPEMAQALVDKGSYNPRGYVLTLAGLRTPTYGQLEDTELDAMKRVLTETSAAFARALSQRPSLGGSALRGEIDENQIDEDEEEDQWSRPDE